MPSTPSHGRCLTPFAPLAALALLVATGAAPLAAQSTTDNPCDQAVAAMNKQIVDSYDNLEQLDALLQSWTSAIQDGMEYFSPEALRAMSEAEVTKAQDSLKTLKECLPKMREAFDRLKKRIGELEGMLGVDLSGDRLHQRRMRKIAEVEALHAEVSDLLDSLIG